jgi:hypothetical protein
MASSIRNAPFATHLSVSDGLQVVRLFDTLLSNTTFYRDYVKFIQLATAAVRYSR